MRKKGATGAAIRELIAELRLWHGNQRGWTPDAFEHHVETVFTERGEALRVALEALTRQLAGMNEFRGAINDRERQLMPRVEADIRFSGQQSDISALKASRDTGAGRTIGMSNGAKVAVSAITLFVVLLGLFVTGITVAGTVWAILHK